MLLTIIQFIEFETIKHLSFGIYKTRKIFLYECGSCVGKIFISLHTPMNHSLPKPITNPRKVIFLYYWEATVTHVCSNRKFTRVAEVPAVVQKITCFCYPCEFVYRVKIDLEKVLSCRELLSISMVRKSYL